MAPWVARPFGLWADPEDDERARRWAHDLRADLRQWSSGTVHLNFRGDEGRVRVIGPGAHNLGRLSRVKRDYDPENAFRLHHIVEPA
ncbi:BBE domain-containing protein [Streptomyces sp. ME02-6991-2B]|nr:BBE domain-containing protein [Streptomyces sp. ME02-6991-2B]